MNRQKSMEPGELRKLQPKVDALNRQASMKNELNEIPS